MEKRTKGIAATAIGLALAAGVGIAAHSCWVTEEPTQVAGDTLNTDEGWDALPLVTIGEQNSAGDDINLAELGYRPPGILDGIGAWKWNKSVVRVFVNSELTASTGYAYTLANGTSLRGARVSYFDIDRKSREVCGAGLAYDRVFDRAGNVVTSATQINEGSSTTDGFDRFCSGGGIEKGKDGFEDDIYFCGEEAGSGQQCALDVRDGDIYVVPMLGRASFENLCVLENFKSDKVVILIGDDSTAVAPLYLYIGEKDKKPASGYTPPGFLKRNGLGFGCLYVWVADAGDDDPSTFHATGDSRKGKFKRITHFDASKAGTSGWDSLGFASQSTQYAAANALDSFTMGRPEDCATNPCDGTEAVIVSTGTGGGFGGNNDEWGTTYIVKFNEDDLEEQLDEDLEDINNIKARIRIVYNGDDAGDGQFSGPDFGLRSPDNLDWADDGYIYITEDDAIGAFGTISKIEASVWRLDPDTGKLTRILEIDRSGVPEHQTDSDPTDIGDWETSGVLDVTNLFKHKKGETLLIMDTQSHSLTGGGLAQNASQSNDLVQGGQLLFASKIDKRVKDWDRDCDDDDDDDHGGKKGKGGK